MNVAASSQVNLPAAWRWVKPIGPRASRKSVWPAWWRRATSSRTCLAVAGGPDGCPNGMAEVSSKGNGTATPLSACPLHPVAGLVGSGRQTSGVPGSQVGRCR
jgi:hypothetical protein